MNNSLILKCPKCGHHFYQWLEGVSYCGRCYRCGLTLAGIHRDNQNVPITQLEIDRFAKYTIVVDDSNET